MKMSYKDENFSKWRVADLRSKLSELGLPFGGLKADLVARLNDNLQDEEDREIEEQEGDMIEMEHQQATDTDMMIQQKIRQQQQLLIEQQQQQQEKELFRMQQTALQQEQKQQQHIQSPPQKQLHHHHLQQNEEHNDKEEHHPVAMITGSPLAPPHTPRATFASSSTAVNAPTTGAQEALSPSIKEPGQASQGNSFLGSPPSMAVHQSPSRGTPGSQKQPIRQGGPPQNETGGKQEKPSPPPLMSLQVSAPKEDNAKEVKLPQALEQALAFKNERAKQVGVSPEDVEKIEREGLPVLKESSHNNCVTSTVHTGRVMTGQSHTARVVTTPSHTAKIFGPSHRYENDAEMQVSSKADKEKRKKKKKKKKKSVNRFSQEFAVRVNEEARKKPSVEDMVDVQYVQEDIDLDMSDPMHRHFAKIFETFRISEPEPVTDVKEEVKTDTQTDLKKAPKMESDDSDEDSDEDEAKDDKPKISKRKLKLMKRMSIAELKQTVSRPDVVEMHDITARDPKLLVLLKATRNTVPVPRHWCFKRKYLQGKRGIEKPPFELPDFIKRTGIMEMRAALQEKEDQKTLKAKMRDKVRPKMGKIDIDYQKLHDAFFKWQTKPKMTIHGDLYYEGKEFETKMKDKKPGDLSDDLRIALGMPVGANAHKVPPPWLIAMQRYGPPPSYPNLKIPGLNAPIPDGCSFGYHAGGWGKPPVDSMGKPIYGDVFGSQNKDSDAPLPEEEVERTLWGELESESEEEAEDESEEEEEEEDSSGMVTPGETGLITPSGISSLPAGLETPDILELRKKRQETEMEGGDTPSLYTVLPERRQDNIGRSMMGSTHTYDMSAAVAPTGGLVGSRTIVGSSAQGVEVALDPSELDLVDTEAMAARYEATLRSAHGAGDEDFSDMVAEHAAKQRNKRKKQQQEAASKPHKKYKDFKF